MTTAAADKKTRRQRRAERRAQREAEREAAREAARERDREIVRTRSPKIRRGTVWVSEDEEKELQETLAAERRLKREAERERGRRFPEYFEAGAIEAPDEDFVDLMRRLRGQVAKTAAFVIDRVEPYQVANELLPPRRITVTDIGDLADLSLYMGDTAAGVAGVLKQVRRDVSGIRGETRDLLDRQIKALEEVSAMGEQAEPLMVRASRGRDDFFSSSPDDAELLDALGGDPFHPTALQVAFGFKHADWTPPNHRGRRRRRRRAGGDDRLENGVLGSQLAVLRRVIANFFYLTEPLGKRIVELSESQYDAWNDPIQSPLDEDSWHYGGVRGQWEQQAREEAAETGMYVEIHAPSGDPLFWAAPDRKHARVARGKARFRANARMPKLPAAAVRDARILSDLFARI